MTSAVDGLKQRFMAMSQPDADGVYRNGAAKRKARTDLAMGNLTQLWNEACEAVSFDVPATGIGLGAVGSLARGQVGPSSDLDLAVIYEPHALTDQQLNELANKLWYPIWIPASTSTSRYVPSRNARPSPTATCPQLWDGWTWCRSRGTLDLSKAQPYPYWNDGARPHANVCRNCSAPPNRASTNSAAWLHQPAGHQRGTRGLRDSVLVSALAASWLADRPHGTYDDAVERLLDVRDCIHLVAGKDTNMLLSPYQAKVAAMLGLADPTLPDGEREAKSIDDLQTLLARVGRQIAFSLDSTASRAEHSLTHDKPRFAFFQVFQPRGGGKRQAPTFDVIAPGVAKHEEEIVLAPGAEPAADPNLVLRVAVAAAEFGLPIAPGTLRNLKKCPIGDRNWTDESRELFIRLLASGPALLNVWEDIDFIDVPGKLIPEWLGVRNRPSASAAHRYTIDRHMVEVVTRLGRETPSGGRYDDRHYEALLLAGILHDIGKRPGVANHAAEGARHATVVVERMGFDRDIVRWVTLLVREHLTLSEFATGRNPNDPNVGDDLAGRLDHNPVLLDMLFDLTRADGSSLGATSGETISKQYGWSKWRETLVRTMYNATRYHM